MNVNANVNMYIYIYMNVNALGKASSALINQNDQRGTISYAVSHLDLEQDPDPDFLFNADPDPDFLFEADPDPDCLFDARIRYADLSFHQG